MAIQVRRKVALYAINHIGFCVGDIQASVKWYTKPFGFELIGNNISHIKRAETPNDPIFGIYPESLQDVKVAHMATGNGVGFELFEFGEPKWSTGSNGVVAQFEEGYNQRGFFHICVTDPFPDEVADRVVEAGGRYIGQGKAVKLADDTVDCLYVADPWGNVVEVINTSFDRLASRLNGES